MRIDRRRHHAISLIEVLVITAIVSLGLLPVISLITHTAKRVLYNEEMVTANLWAVQLIERHQLIPLEKLKSRFAGSGIDASTLLKTDPILKSWWNSDALDDRSRSFLNRYRVVLFYEPDDTYPDMLGHLVCRVTWTDKNGKERQQERVLLVENTDQWNP